jgi:hypothetical protein
LEAAVAETAHSVETARERIGNFIQFTEYSLGEKTREFPEK